jgi:uncharacterized protein (TIGR03089 family)
VPAVLPDVPAVLRGLLAAGPGRPRVTWYGPGGERVELSAKVLDNWVSKTANLLVDELDAGPGSAVLVDLPGHWRTVTWLLAVWAVGAAAVLPGGGEPPTVPELPAGLHPDAVVTYRPALWDGAAAGSPFVGAPLLAVALPALATRFTDPLPEGAVDAATEVRAHGDVFVPAVRPARGDPALVAADGTVTPHGRLTAEAAEAAGAAGWHGWPQGVRLLTGAGPDRALDVWLAALVSGGSLVLHHDLAALDTTSRDRLISQEGVHARA